MFMHICQIFFAGSLFLEKLNHYNFKIKTRGIKCLMGEEKYTHIIGVIQLLLLKIITPNKII